jgi:YidC/Oxa1 family membrane protein insertase
MMLTLLVVIGYQFFVSWLYQKNNWKVPGQDATTQQVAPATTQTSGESTSQSTTAPSYPTTQTASITTAPTAPATNTSVAVATTQSGGMRAVAAKQAQPISIGSSTANDPNYVMQIDISPNGASVDGVTLNQYKLKVGSPEPYTFDKPADMSDEDRALATRYVIINGQKIDLSGVPWTLEKSDESSARYFVDIESNGSVIARVFKIYSLDKRQDSVGKSEGYEVTVTQEVVNRTDAPMSVKSSYNGPLAPRPEASRMDRTFLGAYNKDGVIELIYHSIDELKPENPSKDITKSDKDNKPVEWVGVGGTYFNSILRPLADSVNVPPATYIQTILAYAIHPELQHEHPEVMLNFQTVDHKLEPGATISIPSRVFFGPKPRALLNNGYYNSPLMAYDQTLVMTSGACGFCTFTWLIDVLVWLLTFFHMILRDWGLAIILLVVIVRLILHPITKKSQVSMMKMGKMGPETERLKKKYGDDKEALTKAQMELYKEMGVTPVLGCLPMFLQMPIFIALWQALQSTFELRHAPFLWLGKLHLTWIGDLSQPDRMIKFGTSIPLVFGWHIDAINLLPILVAVVSFLNMKYTPRPPAATPEAEQQQKMMQWMTLIFPLMFYTFPSGLNIYYLTSTSLGIWEGKRIRAHIKEQEEAEKAGKVIVDASPGKRMRGKTIEAPPEPSGCLGGWFANMQERVEQMRLEAEKKNRKR